MLKVNNILCLCSSFDYIYLCLFIPQFNNIYAMSQLISFTNLVRINLVGTRNCICLLRFEVLSLFTIVSTFENLIITFEYVRKYDYNYIRNFKGVMVLTNYHLIRQC